VPRPTSVGEGQSLPGPPADLLGCKERIKYPRANRFRNPRPSIGHRDFRKLTLGARPYRYLSPLTVLYSFFDGGSGVHHQVQNNLVDITGITNHRWKVLIKLGRNLGYIFPLTAVRLKFREAILTH